MELREVIERLERLERRLSELRRKLREQGYSIKKINGFTYVYVWEYINGRQVWRYVGNADRIDLAEFKNERVKDLLQEYKALEEKAKKITEALKDLL